jgi:zinc protease
MKSLRLFRPLALVGFAFAVGTFLRAAAPAGFSHVRTVGGIAEYKLGANDLNVLLLEDHSAPVLTFMVTYRVGSRHEVTGTTGATHLLEHLMFKGSKNFHPGIGKGFDTVMDKIGGINNATTWFDRTNYYENLPSDHLEIAVQLEADRMRGLLLREEDRKPEMTVVRNEFERGENDPAEALDKEVNAIAYLAHPYHHPTIGWRSDIEKVSIAKLREFYDTFYWPDNATVTVIGDFKADTALGLVKKYFGAITRAPRPIPEPYTEEPAQTGPRRVTVKRPGEVGAVQLAYKAPPALHADHAALEILSGILSDGKNCRLYRALIDTNLAINADASKGFFRENTLFSFSALVTPGVKHEQVEQALLAEVEKLRTGGVSAEEVSRAANQRLARLAYGRDGSFAIAGQINEAIAVGDWTVYVSLPDKLRAVTATDVNRVIKTYLNADQSTTGWFVPAVEGGDAGPAPGTPPKRTEALPRFGPRGPHYYRDPESADMRPSPNSKTQSATAAAAGSGGGALIAPNVRRRAIAGADILSLKTSIQDVVTLRGAFAGGDAFNPPGNSAIADLTAGLLDKGTATRDKFAIAGLLEQAGATLGFGTDAEAVSISGKFLRKDLALVLELCGEQLRSPRFDAEEFAKLKKQFAGQRKRALEDTDYRADEAFARAVFPEGHPNRPPTTEQYLADLEAATLDQVKTFHRAHYGPASLRLVLVGDVDDGVIDAALRTAFAGWTGGHGFAAATPAPPLSAGRTEKVAMPGKTSVSLYIGQPSGLRYTAPDRLALNMATSILGSGFFSARLLATIRNQEGLTYGIGAQLTNDTYTDGAWAIRGTFAPDLLDQGLASTTRELTRFCEKGVTAQELADFKVTLSGTYKVQLATSGGVAGTLLNTLQRGLPVTWIDEYPPRLQALTLEQVNASIKQHLAPEKMITVLAGSLPEKK